MKRIRNLGLAIAMALALTASVGATAASASYFSFEKYGAKANAASVGSPVITFSGGRTAECPGVPFSVSTSVPTERLGPGWLGSSCETYEGKATLEMKGCGLFFQPGAETSPGEFAGAWEIGPVGCGPIVLNGPTCDRFFAAQGGLSATYDNEGEGSKAAVAIDATTGSIAYTVTGPEGSCGKGVQYANYLGEWQLTAEGGEGSPLGVHVAPPLGLYLAGEKSEEKAKQPRIEAESYPVHVAGRHDATNKHVLTFSGGRTVKCEEVDFSSGASAATTQLALGAGYTGCKSTLGATTLAATVTMNSCSYALGVLNVGPAYAGSLGVACGKEGDGIEMKVLNGGGALVCTYKISPQAGAEGVGLSTFGAGSERGIAMSLGVKGIAYTRTAGNTTDCGGKSSTASYAGGSTLRALQ